MPIIDKRHDVFISYAHKDNPLPESPITILFVLLNNRYSEEIDVFFDKDGLKLGVDYVKDSFADITDLKFKLMKILLPRLCAYGININENEKFIQINQVNILRNPMNILSG